MVHPTGPAKPRNAVPTDMPPPPAANAPPPSQARAALFAAAPDNAEMAVPVEATPKVVATPIAAVGPMVATAIPKALRVAPAPDPPSAAFACFSASLISSSLFSNVVTSVLILCSSTANSFGVLAN